VALALEGGFRFHYIGDLVPVAKPAGLDCVQKKHFLLCGPAKLEYWLEDRFKDEKWVRAKVGLGLDAN
jgi:hypothetical protein